MESQSLVSIAAIELEQAVLGALLLERSPWLKVPDLIPGAEVFHHRDHAAIYDVGLDLFRRGLPVDLLTVVNGLKERGQLSDNLSPFYVSQLTNKVASTVHVEHHCRILVQKYLSRKLAKIGGSLALKASDEGEDPFELLDRVSVAISGLYGVAMPSAMGTAADVVQELTDASPAKHYTFGIPDLDRKAVFQAGLPHVFAGRPGIGKSIFAVEVCWHLTLVGPVLLFSPEMTMRQVTARILARECGVPYSVILQGAMNEQQMDLVTAAGIRLSDRLTLLKVDPTSGIAPQQMRMRSERAIQQHGVIALAVDHLHKMKTGNAKVDINDFARVGQCMNGITEIAKETNLPTLVMCQLNRAVESREGKRPNMADLRGTGEIEQDAAVVGLLYRDGYYQEDPPMTDTLEINVAKNRDGGTGLARADIEPAFSRIGISATPPFPKFHAPEQGQKELPNEDQPPF